MADKSALEHDFELATRLRDEAVSDLYTANIRNELLELALKEISKGVGAYSQDQLTNAGNTIDSIVKIADKAIADCDG